MASAVHGPASTSPPSVAPDELPLLPPELPPELEPLLDPELLPLLDPELLPELEPLLELALPSGSEVPGLLLLLLQAPMVMAVREARVKTEMVANVMRRLMGGRRTSLLVPSPADLLNNLRQSDDAWRRLHDRSDTPLRILAPA